MSFDYSIKSAYTFICIWRYSTVGFAGLNGRGAFRNGREAITNGRLPRRLRYAAKALGMRGAHDRLPALANKAAGDRLASLPRKSCALEAHGKRPWNNAAAGRPLANRTATVVHRN